MAQTGPDTGSYQFSSLGYREEELTRLAQQAEAAWPDEKRILEWLGLSSGKLVLDVGCGPGFLTRLMARNYPGTRFVGLELDETLVQTARSVGEDGDLFTVRQGSIYESSLEDNSFDFAYARLVFQHLAEPGLALKELWRILKPGGVLAVADVDDGLFMIYPEPPGFDEVVSQTARLQAEKGGDRMIGRKMPHLMANNGFINTDFRPFMVTSRTMGREVFLKVALSFRCARTAGKEAGQEGFEAMASDIRSRDGYGVVGVYAVRGEKANHA